MSFSKIAMYIVMGSVWAPAFADDHQPAETAGNMAVETYTYSTPLDIQKVISVTDVSDKCGATPVRMTYQDSHGQQHVIEYQGVGIACTNG
ncbi:DUF2790 domain-containing protein [Pseudomonas abietaniphila]|jgi:hypothetical protein|uniref:DUF2790 domain-containing protein n=1 Tax=Pseudomonas abietaniphila TaxID=89065 RepID=A0A1G8G530_9PSED|nr:DUF2790 domain-containing protein [Pseudomonas abietaniphila]SDH89455.1 Protein of unknown function [Pseudomonas abietaniphila]